MGGNTWNVDMYENTYKAPADLQGHEFHTRSIGYSRDVTGGTHSGMGFIDVEGDVTFNDEIYGSGTAEKDTRHQGYDPGSYEYYTNRSITVSVTDDKGAPVEGVLVGVADVFGTRNSNLSDAQGIVKVHVPAYLTRGVGSAFTETNYYPYSITVTSGSTSVKTTIDILDTRKNVDVNVTTGVVEVNP